MRSQPMASLAVKPWCFIIKSAMRVPVRPKPARQCTASTWPSLSASARRKKASIMLLGGTEQSAVGERY